MLRTSLAAVLAAVATVIGVQATADILLKESKMP
jgi:hypothetical protein